MAEFKLCIGDSSGKCYQKEVKDAEASLFLGKNIGDVVKGDNLGLAGYELQVTGGSDHCGFPMRKGILGMRKRITLTAGIGIRENMEKGIKKKKTICGHKIHPKITQVNVKVVKEGTAKLDALLGKPEAKTEKT